MVFRRRLLAAPLVATTAALPFPFLSRAHAATTLRLHTLVTSPHPYNTAAEWFGEELARRTNGALRSTLFPSAQLGTDRAVLDEMRLGTIDLMISTTNNAAAQLPAYDVFSLAYLFPDYESFRRALRPAGPIVQRIQALYDERRLGLVLLGFMLGGTRNLSAVRPVRSLEDLRGLKMRVPPSPAVARQWQALGTLPVTVNWAEVYTAVQTGVAQALESSLSGYLSERFFEVAPTSASRATRSRSDTSQPPPAASVGWRNRSARSCARLPPRRWRSERAPASKRTRPSCSAYGPNSPAGSMFMSRTAKPSRACSRRCTRTSRGAIRLAIFSNSCGPRCATLERG